MSAEIPHSSSQWLRKKASEPSAWALTALVVMGVGVADSVKAVIEGENLLPPPIARHDFEVAKERLSNARTTATTEVMERVEEAMTTGKPVEINVFDLANVTPAEVQKANEIIDAVQKYQAENNPLSTTSIKIADFELQRKDRNAMLLMSGFLVFLLSLWRRTG